VRYVLGIDVGGTFTDCVAADLDGNIYSGKAPSTPPNFAVGVLASIEATAETMGIPAEELLQQTEYISHGTTSTLNALVTGNVAKTGFITTKGHRDSIFIMNVEGRHLGRPSHELQNVLAQQKPPPLVPRALTKELTERVDRAGHVVVPLNEKETRQAVHECMAENVAGIAVSLLWSFKNPTHEQRVRDIIPNMSSCGGAGTAPGYLPAGSSV